MFEAAGLSLPALRGRQGSRTLYLALPTNSMLNNFFPIDIEPAEDRSQRQLDPSHSREIAHYLSQNPQDYALGAITYAVDQEGTFAEVEPGSGIGLLKLPLNARLRSIDGQHRRDGIRLAIESVADLARQSTALLIYVEHDLAKRRQMFSDMNNTARKVSKGLNVSYDSRDPFARVASELSDGHPMLDGRIDREASRVQPGSGKLFTLASIHDAIKRLFVGPTGRVKDASQFDAQEISNRASAFLDILQGARPELAPGMALVEVEALRASSILLSSTTLRVLASAMWTATQGGGRSIVDSQERFTRHLSNIDFRASAQLWAQIGFVSPGRTTPNARSQEMKAASDAIAELLEGEPVQTDSRS